jgi:hypothetical protein
MNCLGNDYVLSSTCSAIIFAMSHDYFLQAVGQYGPISCLVDPMSMIYLKTIETSLQDAEFKISYLCYDIR